MTETAKEMLSPNVSEGQYAQLLLSQQESLSQQRKLHDSFSQVQQYEDNCKRLGRKRGGRGGRGGRNGYPRGKGGDE